MAYSLNFALNFFKEAIGTYPVGLDFSAESKVMPEQT